MMGLEVRSRHGSEVEGELRDVVIFGRCYSNILTNEDLPECVFSLFFSSDVVKAIV